MRQKSLLKTMLLLCALIVGGGSAWAETVTLDVTTNPTDLNYTATGTSGTGGDVSFSKSGITISSNKGYRDGTSHIRVYSGGSLSISSSVGTITKVEITSTASGTSNNGPSKISVPNSGSGTYSYSGSVGTWTGSTTTVNLSATAQFRFTKVVVTYTPSVSKKNTTLALDPTSLNLIYGGNTGTLTATVTPVGESALSNPNITWKSDDESVATVSGGTVTPVGEGSTTITATYAGNDSYNGSTNTATVNVTDNRIAVVSAIEKINSIKSLYIGGKHAFSPVVALADGLSANDITYSYVSADPTTIQINDDGTYTALKTGTNIDITVTVTPIDAKASTHKPVSATFQHNGAYKYSKPVFTTTGVTEGNFSGSMTLAMANDGTPTGPIYYTLDGEEPATDKSNGTLYTDELTLTETKTVKARIIDNDGYYSTVTSATYTKVPYNKDAITLAVDQTLSFTDFTAFGAYGTDEEEYVIASDGDNYKFTSTNVGSFNNNKLMQIQDNASAYTTLSPVTAPYGFRMTLTVTAGSVKVYVGENFQTAVSSNTYDFTSNSATSVTIKRNSGTTKISNITLIGLKAPVATNVAITDPGTLAKDATGTFTYTKDDEADCTKAWTSATTGVINITDAATGAYTAAGRGTAKITLTLTPSDATSYRAVTAERTVSVTEPVVVTANDVTMAFGDAAKAIGATTSTGYTGTLSYASGNENIATVDATGKVTAVATGSTTITITAPADATNLFTASSREINVTVNAPAGSGETPTASKTEIYSNTLLYSSLPEGWIGDGSIWSGSSSYGAVTAAGTIGNSYDLKTPTINLNGNYSAAEVSFQHTGNQTFSTSGTGRADACKLFVKDGDTETQLTIGTMFAGNSWTYVTNTTSLNDYIGKSIQLIFRYTPSSGNQGKWEVKNFKVQATPIQTTTATVANSGYGTYCYEYPLNLDQLDEDVKAYIVTNVSGSTVTFTQVTGKIKGGVPFILYGTAGSHTLTTAASSTTVPANNMLVGTLAPKYVTTVEGEYTNFGLSQGSFVKINSGTVPAHKAYLPILTTNVPTSSARLNIVFDDATGIANMKAIDSNTRYYDLQGRRIDNPTKGGLYIVNGKKVVMK